MRAQLLLAAVLAGLLGACSEGVTPSPPVAATSTPTQTPTPEFTLPACDPFVPKDPLDEDVPGLIPPGDALQISAVKRHEQTPITQVTGFVSMNPIGFRRYYEKRRDIKVLQSEDEGFEAELLITDGRYRNFLKVRIQCNGGSQFVAVIAKEVAGSAVPTPTGSPSG